MKAWHVHLFIVGLDLGIIGFCHSPHPLVFAVAACMFSFLAGQELK